jgi:ABC-type glycerol-3-phosphate transport system permease component
VARTAAALAEITSDVVAALIGQYDTIWNMLCSSAIIFAIPPLVLFFLFEKALLKGLTAGAVKV